VGVERLHSNDRACGLQLLLEHGADPNAQNEWGNSLLHHQPVGHANEMPLRHLAEISGLLVSIYPFVVNTAGLTPLDLARQRKAEQPDDPARAVIRSLSDVQEQIGTARCARASPDESARQSSRTSPSVLACLDAEACAYSDAYDTADSTIHVLASLISCV
jgi:hypothetical protein